MKKVIISMIALISMAQAFGAINWADPRLTPEEQAHLRMLNQTTAEGYREHNEKVRATRDKEIAQATINFIGKVRGMKNLDDKDAELMKFIEEVRDIKMRNQNIITG